MSEKNFVGKAETITCPECTRVWPVMSEQGAVCTLYGKCYACLIEEVNTTLTEQRQAADYAIDNCPECMGGARADREKCVNCGGRGWVVVDKQEEPRIQLIQ